MIGIMITEEEYQEYQFLKKKNTPVHKIQRGKICFSNKYCPACNYVVDNAVPPQNYCDNCGQKFYVK